MRGKGKGNCPKCGRGSVLFTGYGFPKPRPEFICGSCGNSWSCGLDGGEHMVVARKYHSKNKLPFPLKEIPNA